MARNLYRVYLYSVFIAMLIFAAVGLGMLLQTLYSLTPLRGTYGTIPTNASIVQATVLFAVSWLIAAIFGILHYWLIRRDMHNDPAAGRGAIRSFFLNITELIVAPLAIVSSSIAVIAQLGHDPAYDLTDSAAFATVLLLLLVVLELERQRRQAGTSVAMAFQRLHLYGVQLILLIVLTFSWNNTVFQLGDAFIFHGQVAGTIACGGFSGCQGTNLLSLVVATLWLVVFWIGYGFFTRNDSASLLRSILHFASFAYGVGLILYGISRAIELGILALFNVTLSASEILNSYNFVALITLGLLIAGVYALWLRITARKELSGGVLRLYSSTCSRCLLALLLGHAIGRQRLRSSSQDSRIFLSTSTCTSVTNMMRQRLQIPGVDLFSQCLQAVSCQQPLEEQLRFILLAQTYLGRHSKIGNR